jgi:hypothetical protein
VCTVWVWETKAKKINNVNNKQIKGNLKIFGKFSKWGGGAKFVERCVHPTSESFWVFAFPGNFENVRYFKFERTKGPYNLDPPPRPSLA